ncbi:MAG: DUF983 domain-containing protein [Planctomycetales bacterium]|nr:DUF983 domain-containing protein [Planctomycetales bacterium]
MSRYWRIFGRSVRLRCPVCGRGKLFCGALKMHQRCPECDADFHREEGFFLGSIYLNYGLTTLIVAVGYPALLFSGTLSNDALLWIALAVVLVVPLLFFRHARSLWLGFDQFWDPRPGEIGGKQERP